MWQRFITAPFEGLLRSAPSTWELRCAPLPNYVCATGDSGWTNQLLKRPWYLETGSSGHTPPSPITDDKIGKIFHLEVWPDLDVVHFVRPRLRRPHKMDSVEHILTLSIAMGRRCLWGGRHFSTSSPCSDVEKVPRSSLKRLTNAV